MYVLQSEISEKLKKMMSVMKDSTKSNKGILVKDERLFTYGDSMHAHLVTAYRSKRGHFLLPPNAGELILRLPAGAILKSLIF